MNRRNTHSSQSRSLARAAHMTWATRSVSRTLMRTKAFLGARLWAWPIIAVVLLLAIGWLVHGAIEQTMVENLRSDIETLRNVEVAMLETWLASHESNGRSRAGDVQVRHIASVLADPQQTDDADLEKLRQDLAKELNSVIVAHNYDSFFVADRSKILADSYGQAVGMEIPAPFHKVIEGVFAGETTVIPPFKSVMIQTDEYGVKRTGVPTMFVLAPIQDDNLQVVAVLGLRIRPEKEFTRILQLGTWGNTGETYAFNAEGLMLSISRFDDELIRQRILPDEEGIRSILRLLIRDPGGNLLKGFQPEERRAKWPLTAMVARAVAEGSGSDLQGYRDYRGVTVVGAWTWLTKYNFGVGTQVDYEVAFRPLTILKRTFWGLLFLLTLSAVAIFAFTLIVARLQTQAREAAIEAKQLGQYQLEEKLGEGAMGVVYKGRHSLLRRPTAIKLLNAGKVTPESIARFEREVQITSHLNHPNTVAIYDFGRTPEDVFYYAMEYLDGIDLQKLVDTYGPQPPGRVIYILRQICGSLYEAHSLGLVHRDVKPANVMLNWRGGEGDVVKVLDFGLVKARGEAFGKDEDEGTLAGTPLYMSPEAIQLPNSVDACSDIYAVGAVGYFLLTGQPVFEADTLVGLCQMHASEAPKPPSIRLGRPVPEELENAILSCLEKGRSRRPQTARELARMIGACPAADEWSLDEANAWWSRHERGQLESVTNASSPTLEGGHDATVLFESK